jgi:hypothetical protein
VADVKVSRRLWAVMIGYTLWMIIFTIVCSPLGLKLLKYEEMGFNADTVISGIIVGLFTAVLIGLGELLPIPIRRMMYKDVKTTQQFKDMWKVQMIGGYDGFIAEPHWSGAILPLALKLLTSFNISYPLTIILAIAVRWILHCVSHLLFPSVEHGHRAFGEMLFTMLGLLVFDIVISAAFLISGNILAPIIIHTFMQPFAELFGVKKKLAKELGIALT